MYIIYNMYIYEIYIYIICPPSPAFNLSQPQGLFIYIYMKEKSRDRQGRMMKCDKMLT